METEQFSQAWSSLPGCKKQIKVESLPNGDRSSLCKNSMFNVGQIKEQIVGV